MARGVFDLAAFYMADLIAGLADRLYAAGWENE